MRTALSVLLVFEAIIVLLSIPVATSSGVSQPLAVGIGAGVAAGCVAVCALLGRPVGRIAGSVLQVVTFGLGILVPAMFVLGAIFGTIWIIYMVIDRRLEGL